MNSGSARRRPARPHIVVVSLVGLSDVGGDGDEFADLERCDFMRKRRAKKDVEFDAEFESNVVAQHCLLDAAGSAPGAVQINGAERCILPRDWHAFVDTKLGESRIYYCNARTRQGAWGRKVVLKPWKAKNTDNNNNNNKNEGDDDGNNKAPNNVDSLAMRLYASRYEKDLARSVDEWRFFAQHNALEQLWSMPLVGNNIDPLTMFANNT